VVAVVIVVIVVLSGVKMRITVIYVHVLSVLDVCTHDWQRLGQLTLCMLLCLCQGCSSGREETSRSKDCTAGRRSGWRAE